MTDVEVLDAKGPEVLDAKGPEVLDAKGPVTVRVIDPPAANLANYKKQDHQAHKNLARIEDDIYDTSFKVVRDALDFREIDTTTEESAKLTLDRWADEMGSLHEAQKRYQVAKSGWQSAKNMPAGVKLAQELFVGITKARAKQPAQHVHITAKYVAMPVQQQYPELLEENDD